jgi:hypothetical protein
MNNRFEPIPIRIRGGQLAIPNFYESPNGVLAGPQNVYCGRTGNTLVAIGHQFQ